LKDSENQSFLTGAFFSLPKAAKTNQKLTPLGLKGQRKFVSSTPWAFAEKSGIFILVGAFDVKILPNAVGALFSYALVRKYPASDSK